jgi:hypothetical protein
MMNMKNRRGVAPIVVVLGIFGVILLIYLLLYLPIPAFKAMRYSINYWMILLVFFSVQAGIIYIFYKLISLSSKGFKDLKGAITNYTNTFKDFINLKFRV